LDRANISYRLPVLGGRISGGRLQANALIAGLKIQVRTGKAPWRAYTGPIAVKGPALLRTLSPDGRRVSRTAQAN
jgi:hexosaminidase